MANGKNGALRGLFQLRVAPSPTIAKLLGLGTVALLLLFWWLATRGATPETRRHLIRLWNRDEGRRSFHG